MILSINKKGTIPKNNKFDTIHLSRPLPVKNIEIIIEMKKKLSMSQSTYKRLSKKAKLFLKEKKVKFEFFKKPGRPINLNAEKVLKIIEYYHAGFPLRKIEEKLNVPKSTIHYMIKHSKRNRIKYNDKTVFID